MFSLINYLYNTLNSSPDKFNIIYYLWKRNNWMLDIRSYTGYFSKIPFEDPIFLLGNQGDGLTLLSRMLRRNPNVVNVTGNSKYWAGADEMMNVNEQILTPEISGMVIGAPYYDKLPPPRGWSYACNDLIKFYRKTEKDINYKNRKKLKAAIGMAISHHGRKIKNPRFLDKSQIFSVKMAFINKLLEEHNPYFIFITRNPYATIYRAAIGKARDMARASDFLSFKQRLNICLEHWLNTIKIIEEDQKKVNNFLWIRLEDLLNNPKEILKKVCNFSKLEFNEDMIPKSYHKFPLGVRFKERWYPLNPSVNQSYLRKLPQNISEIIFKACGKYAQKYGYNSPK